MRILIGFKNHLNSIIQALSSRELNEDENKFYKNELNDYYGLIIAFSAAFRRPTTLSYYLALPNASLDPLHQWINGHEEIQENDISFSISNNNMRSLSNMAKECLTYHPDFISQLASISPEIHSTIITTLKYFGYKDLMNNQYVRSTFPEIDEFVISACQKDEGEAGFVEAIRAGNLSFIQQHACQDFSEEFQNYTVVLAASLAKADILKNLIHQKLFPTIRLINYWMGLSWHEKRYYDQNSLWNYEYSEFGRTYQQIEKDFNSVLIEQIQQNNEDYLALVDDWIHRKGMDANQQTALIRAAIELDKPDIVSVLTTRFHCHLEPDGYDWEKEQTEKIVEGESRCSGYYYCRHSDHKDGNYDYRNSVNQWNGPNHIDAHYSVKPATDDLRYASALLMAANSEKIKVLAWLLTTNNLNTKSYQRCVDIANAGNRPSLAAHFKLFAAARPMIVDADEPLATAQPSI